MKSDRRTFLKTSGLVGGALLAGSAGPTQVAQAQTSAPLAAKRTEIPKGFTFCTLRKGNTLSLGLRTDKGILDVAPSSSARPPRSRPCSRARAISRR